MKRIITQTSEELGELAATHAAGLIETAISEKGSCRLLLATAASQLETLANLQKKNIDWSKVEIFHLDEYIGLPENHGASFARLLKERFIDGIGKPKAVYYIDGVAPPEEAITKVSKEIHRAPVDIALVGIGENAHIAFNDPPADFETKDAYKVVNLDDACRRQQHGEGWFPSFDDVPKTAISMTVYQIMQSKVIISVVPHKQKAKAVFDTINNDLTPEIPATMLKTHPNWTLYLDSHSASLL